MALHSSSGNPEVDHALEVIIQQIETLLPDAHLGFYLHGSAATGNAGSHSDIDVLGLATEPVSKQQRDDARALVADLARTLNIDIDFHLHPIQSLIADPYVDLRRTGTFLAGEDVRPMLPSPTLDALAREAVLVTCILVTDIRGQDVVTWPLTHPNADDRYFGRLQDTPPRGFAKTLTWITSARLAGKYGYAPTGSADALQALSTHNDRYGEWVNTTVRFCRQVDLASATETEHNQLQVACHDALAFENDTLAILHTAVTGNGVLGEKCGKVLDTYIKFPE
jgi:predicted nucleotidyltransferase